MSGGNRTIALAGRQIGAGAPVFLIAEAGVNHDGDPQAALALIAAAAEAGADAVKFQTFRANELATAQVEQAEYQRGGQSESQLEMLRRLELPREVYPRLVERCAARDVLFLSTPFDLESARFLAGLGMPAFKIPSGELTNLPFLKGIAAFGLPVILSTGMGTMDEVATAVETMREAGAGELVLLHCTSNYPAAPETVNLRAMETLRRRFGDPVGFSDHTRGCHAAVAAVALGARVIEKHFTLSRTRPGPDHAASLEPQELKSLVDAVRECEAILGSGEKVPAASEAAVRQVVRRYLCAAQAVQAGETVTAAHLAAKRCPGAILPGRLDDILGKRFTRDLRVEEPLREGDWE